MKKFILVFLVLAAVPSTGWAMAKMPPKPAETPAAPEPLPITLEECYQLALEQSESLAMKDVDVDKTWADFLAASGELIGDGSFVMTDFIIERQGGSTSGEGATANAFRTERREKKFVISQPLFQGFREVAAIAGAGHLRGQREQEARRARQVLFLDVVTAYYAVLRTKRDLEINTEILKLYQERLRDLGEREEIGKSRASEAINARSRMRIIEADAAELRGTAAFQRRLLEFLTGIPLENRRLTEDSEELPRPEDLDAYLIHTDERSDVRAAYHASKIGFQNVVSAQSELWPDISLNANMYEQREGFQSGIDWDVLFTIDVPIWTGGTNLGAIKAAVSDWKKTKLSFSESRRKAELEIKQSYELWRAALDRYEALRESALASEENYKFQKEDYQNSLVNNLDVLDALQDLNNARIESSRAYYEVKASYWRMKVATGDCCESV